jgi:uncharacterized membrane protein
VDGDGYIIMTKDQGLLVQESAGQDILKARLARGDIEKDGLIFTKRGINK